MSQRFATYAKTSAQRGSYIRAAKFSQSGSLVLTWDWVRRGRCTYYEMQSVVGEASPLCPQGKVLFLRRYGALAVPLKCDCLIDRYFVITHTYNRGAL